MELFAASVQRRRDLGSAEGSKGDRTGSETDYNIATEVLKPVLKQVLKPWQAKPTLEGLGTKTHGNETQDPFREQFSSAEKNKLTPILIGSFRRANWTISHDE